MIADLLKKSFSFLMWALAGAFVIPAVLISYLFFEKWVAWFEGL